MSRARSRVPRDLPRRGQRAARQHELCTLLAIEKGVAPARRGRQPVSRRAHDQGRRRHARPRGDRCARPRRRGRARRRAPSGTAPAGLADPLLRAGDALRALVNEESPITTDRRPDRGARCHLGTAPSLRDRRRARAGEPAAPCGERARGHACTRGTPPPSSAAARAPERAARGRPYACQRRSSTSCSTSSARPCSTAGGSSTRRTSARPAQRESRTSSISATACSAPCRMLRSQTRTLPLRRSRPPSRAPARPRDRGGQGGRPGRRGRRDRARPRDPGRALRAARARAAKRRRPRDRIPGRAAGCGQASARAGRAALPSSAAGSLRSSSPTTDGESPRSSSREAPAGDPWSRSSRSRGSRRVPR